MKKNIIKEKNMKANKEKTAKFQKVSLFLKQNINCIYAFFIGISIGFILLTFFIPDRIAKLANNEEPVVSVNGLTITADNYYEKLKDNISVELLLQDIDKYLLNTLYETTKEIKKEVTNKMNNIIDEYTSYYQYSEKDFLEANSLKDRDTFYELLEIDYKRNLYYEDYIKSKITDDEIKKLYNRLSPDIEIKYITIKDEDLKDTILKELKKGSNYDEIIKKHKKDITYKNLDYVSFDKEITTEIKEAAYKLKANSYTEKALELNNSYTIVFRGKSKEKEELNNLKKRIKEYLKKEKINSDSDKKLYNQSLIYLREENNITFKDTVLGSEYKQYISQFK